MLGRDPRLTRLASLLGWSKRETAGCLVLDVWPICYDRTTAVLPEDDIDVAAGVKGFAKALCDSGLAQRVDTENVRVSGATVRVRYLEASQDWGRVGGKRSGEVRRAKKEYERRVPFDENEGGFAKPRRVGNLPDSVPDRVIPPVPDDQKKTRDGSRGVHEPDPWDEPDARPPAPSQVAIDHFHERYRAAYDGHAPNWSGRAAATVARLAKRHGADEVCARVDRLFDGRGPAWLQPPYTVGTLSSQWDALAVDAPARGGNRETGVEYAMRRAREADDRIRNGKGNGT